MTGDTTQALEIAEKVFRLEGEVVPATPDNVQLEITYTDGSVVVGEHTLDQDVKEPKKIDHVRLVPNAVLSPKAREAIEAADLIVIGPGDYYASLMAALVPNGMKEAIAKTSAKVLYFVNLMTRLTQTHEMTAQEHLEGIEKVIGRPVDWVVVNDCQIPAEILQFYASHQEFPVKDDLGTSPNVIRADLISEEMHKTLAVDTAHRSLLRHDVEKVRAVLAKLLPS
jgi:uncharacterized cofD-like protein